MSYRIGSARVDFTPKSRNIPMMGWGDERHLVKGVSTPIYARAVVIQNDQDAKRLIMVCVDLCCVTELLRAEVIKRLGLSEDEVMLSATHTHSAPGGYSSYVLYDLSTNGFQSEVFESYANGVIAAIQAAIANLKPGTVRYVTGEFPLNQDVAFNRSIRAWNRNPEVKKYTAWDREKATNREMRLLRFDDENGNPIASWNWFSVHATSVHRNSYKIHSDNKGVAATMLEQYWHDQGVPGFVAVFAQGAAGDISPNFKRHSFFAEKSGPYLSDEENCRFNANFQFKKALELMIEAKDGGEELTGDLRAQTEYSDFSKVEIDPDLVGNRLGLRTGDAQVGLPQLYGTAEGRGAPWWLIQFVKIIYRIGQIFILEWWSRPVQGVKITVIAAGKSEVFGARTLHKMVIPNFIHPTIGLMKRWSKRGLTEHRSLVPQILPLQVMRIGDLAIAIVPAEFTTVSGWRLENLVHRELKETGVGKVVVQGYANAFSSYVTTPEEYDQQSYEGGCTLFGKYTLPAYLTRFRALCRKIRSEQPSSPLRPKPVDKAYLEAMT